MRNAYRTLSSTEPASFWLTLGDNAYDRGTDIEYQNSFFNIYTPMLQQLCHWSCIGNHETEQVEGPGTWPYDSIFAFPTAGECGGVASGTERYYSFDWSNVHFIILDAMTSSREADGAQANWIRSDLGANTKPWLVAAWHHPPYDKGTHDSDAETPQIQMRSNLVPILENHGVDLILCGHSHVYQRTVLLDGHYGLSRTFSPEVHAKNAGDGKPGRGGAYWKPASAGTSHDGAVYVVCGNSGQTGSFDSGGTHPANIVNLTGMGSMIIDVRGSRLDARYIQQESTLGAATVVGDSFSIIKGGPPPDVPLAPGGLRFLHLSRWETLVSWDDASSNELGYRVSVSYDGGGAYTELAALPAGSVCHRMTDMIYNRYYMVKVEAWNAVGTVQALTGFIQPRYPEATTALEQWRFCNLGTTQATGSAADTADKDGDGYANLLEYGMGTLPQVRASSPGIMVSKDGDRLKLTFPRKALPLLTYVVEFSSSLTAGTWNQGFISTGAANTDGTVITTDPLPLSGLKRFARVRVSR